MANSKSLLNCLFKAQILENKSSQLLGMMHNLQCFPPMALFTFQFVTGYLKCSQSFSQPVHLFSIHYMPSVVHRGLNGDRT